jgi:hypothetical protein
MRTRQLTRRTILFLIAAWAAPALPLGEWIWMNSLFFYPDRVVVKTFDHTAGAWMEKLERTVRPVWN